MTLFTIIMSVVESISSYFIPVHFTSCTHHLITVPIFALMHHLSLPRPFTPDLKPICSTNPFLHSHSSGSIWTTRIESGFGLGTDLGYCASAFCFCFFFYIFYSVRGYLNYRLSWMHRQLGLFSPRWTRSIVLQSVATHGKGRTGLYYVMLSNVIRPKLFDVGFDYWLSDEGTSKYCTAVARARAYRR